MPTSVQRVWVPLLSMVFSVVTLLAAPTPSAGALLTLDFSGTADLSPFGASATSTFDGSVTWDSDTPANPSNPTAYLFSTAGGSATVAINGTDYSSRVSFLSNFQVNESGSGDSFTVLIFFSPLIDLGVGPDVDTLLLSWFNGEFLSSPTVPQDFAFLTAAGKNQQIQGNTTIVRPTTFNASPAATGVPAPPPVILLACGAAALGVGFRFRR